MTRPVRPSSRRSGALVVAVLLVLAGACAGEDDGGPPASVRTTEAAPVPGATVGTTPLTTPEDEPVPELAVPIVSAEVAVDVLLAAVEEAFDPEEPDWGLPAAWREVAPDALFTGPATTADPETISGVEVVVSGDGDEVMAVAVADEDDRCATLILVGTTEGGGDAEGSEAVVGWRSEYGPEPDTCSGEAALSAWEARQDDTADESAAAFDRPTART